MKKILAFLLAAFLLVSLCACGSKESNNSSEIMLSVGKTEEVEVKAAENVFPENTVVEIKAISSGDDYETANTALKATAKKFTVYDITAKSENVSVQPNGTVEATFDVPAEYDLDRIAVVYISDDGKAETLSCTVDKTAKTVTAQLSHFSLYAVVELVEEDTQSTISEVTSSDSASETSSNNTSLDKPAESSKPSESSKPAHTHSFAAATCTSAKKCACGVTEGKALGHDYVEDKCSRCGAIDKTYKALTSGYWTVAVVDGNTLYDVSFVFSGEEPNASIGIGDNIKGLPEEFQNEILNNPADYSDSILKVGNETYYVGRGFGCPITFEANKNTVVITEMDSTNTITLTRTAGDKYKITAISGDFMGEGNTLKVGIVLTWKEAEIAEN